MHLHILFVLCYRCACNEKITPAFNASLHAITFITDL